MNESISLLTLQYIAFTHASLSHCRKVQGQKVCGTLSMIAIGEFARMMRRNNTHPPNKVWNGSPSFKDIIYQNI